MIYTGLSWMSPDLNAKWSVGLVFKEGWWVGGRIAICVALEIIITIPTVTVTKTAHKLNGCPNSIFTSYDSVL